MSLTKATYSMINGAPINVLDYGADPTGTNDSTTAINAALAAGVEIIFPAGTYKVTSIVMPDKLTIIRGEGQENTTIHGSGGYVVTYSTNTASRFSQLNDLTILADAGCTALRIRNLGVHLTNVTCRGGHTGILLQNSVMSQWNSVASYGSAYGVVVEPETASDVVWLCNFTDVSTSGNTFADLAIGFYCDWGASSTIGFMRYCTFTQLDAEQIETGIMLLNQSAIDNTFINSWVEVCAYQYVLEADGCRNTWINTQLTPGGAPAPTQAAHFSANSLIMQGPSIAPTVNGGITVGTINVPTANYYEPIGVNLLANVATASSSALYASNTTHQAHSQFEKFISLEKTFLYDSIATNTAIIEVEFLEAPAGFVEVELAEYGAGVASGCLKYRKAVNHDGSTGLTFATIDTNYKNTNSDITFTSVSSTKFRLTYTYTSTQPPHVGLRVKVAGLAGYYGSAGVTMISLI